ncbi:hypothetical protein [Providencia phage PSTCR9]|nr:hypothetical protein [Providencia phage PSTCR9]
MIILKSITNENFNISIHSNAGRVFDTSIGFEDIRVHTSRAAYRLSTISHEMGDVEALGMVPKGWFNRVRFWAHCMEILIAAHQLGFHSFDFLHVDLLPINTLLGDIKTPLIIPSLIGGANLGTWKDDCYLITSPLAADGGKSVLVCQGENVLEDAELTQSELDAGASLNQFTVLTDLQTLRQPYLVNEGDLFCDLFDSSVGIVLNAVADKNGNIVINSNGIANINFMDR